MDRAVLAVAERLVVGQAAEAAAAVDLAGVAAEVPAEWMPARPTGGTA